jgi:hypothetical protein
MIGTDEAAQTVFFAHIGSAIAPACPAMASRIRPNLPNSFEVRDVGAEERGYSTRAAGQTAAPSFAAASERAPSTSPKMDAV